MPEPSRGWTPNGLCSLFVCDIASFGHPFRNDLDRHQLRTALYAALRSSFDGDGTPFEDCYREDRGDGVLVAVPPSVDTATLLTSLVERLRAELRRHNDVSTGPAQLQLRLAVHTGDVRSDGEGLVATAVNHAFRLLEATQLKQALARTAADLAMIASERVYEDVIRHGLGLVDPGEYQRIKVSVKETTTPAWLRVPGAYAGRRAASLVTDTRIVLAAELTAPDPPAVITIADRPAVPDRPAVITIVDQPTDLDTAVDRALAIRQLRGRHVRDQIVAELPLALATAIRTRRASDDRTDVSAIVRTCREQPHGLQDLLRVVRQFVGDSAMVDEFKKSIDSMGQA